MLKTVDEKMSSPKNAYKETAKTAEIVHLTYSERHRFRIEGMDKEISSSISIPM